MNTRLFYEKYFFKYKGIKFLKLYFFNAGTNQIPPHWKFNLVKGKLAFCLKTP